MLRKLSLERLRGFMVAGGIAAATNVGSRILLSELVSYPVAIVLAYLVGMLTAFVLRPGHVFGTRGKPLHSEIATFAMVNVLAMAQTLAVGLTLAYYQLPWMGIGHHSETIAHLVGVAVPIATTYYGHKYWTFG